MNRLGTVSSTLAAVLLLFDLGATATFCAPAALPSVLPELRPLHKATDPIGQDRDSRSERSRTGRSSLCLDPTLVGGDPLFVVRSGGATFVRWTSDGGGESYDLVRGDLNVLAGDCDHDGVAGDCNGGNFRNALNAISPSSDVCMADNTSSGEVLDPRATPASGRGDFFLMRQVSGCGEDDSYGYGTGFRDRDFGISSANGTCSSFP